MAKPVGKIIHYFDKINVGVVAVNRIIRNGDKIKVGKNDNFTEQVIKSLQINHTKVEHARKGQEVGLKVKCQIRKGDLVFKV